MIRPLGNDRMARVFLAREPELERLVVVKVLRRELARDETARLRFERGARSAASLSHPNVVPIHRFGQLADGASYLVMAHVNGRTLADRLRADGEMSEAEGRTLLLQLASALAAAHRKGIVHRDVKPANVLVDEDSGRFLLSDFWIAALLDGGAPGSERLTQTGQILGEPRYASPEQLQGEKVTPQTDVYSLAVSMYEALTGEGPYQASSAREHITAHLSGAPRPISRIRPGISAPLEDLLLRCLSRQPTHRPRAEDIVKRLGREGDSPGSGAYASPSPTYPGNLLRRRFPQIVLSTLGAGVGLIGLVGTLVDSGRLDDWTLDHSINTAVWALLASVVLAWFHGEKGSQDVPLVEKWLLAILAGGWLTVTVLLALP